MNTLYLGSVRIQNTIGTYPFVRFSTHISVKSLCSACSPFAVPCSGAGTSWISLQSLGFACPLKTSQQHNNRPIPARSLAPPLSGGGLVQRPFSKFRALPALGDFSRAVRTSSSACMRSSSPTEPASLGGILRAGKGPRQWSAAAGCALGLGRG